MSYMKIKEILMNKTSPYNTYTQNNISIESPQKLIEVLYEGILRFNMQGKRAISANDIEKRTYWINRSAAILMELLNSLSFENEGTTSKYLHGLYIQQLKLLAEANNENSIEKIDQVNTVMKSLLEAWRNTTD